MRARRSREVTDMSRRRTFLGAILTAGVAPAIVRAQSVIPKRGLDVPNRVLRNCWGPSGTLSLAGFDTLFCSGYNKVPINAPASALDGRVEFVNIDGYPAVKMSVKAGDSSVAGGWRTKLAAKNYAHIIDWVGEGVRGAVADAAYREYRYCFMVPEQDVSFLKPGNRSFFSIADVHQVKDKNPPDAPGYGTWVVQVRPDTSGNLRYAIFRNRDSAPTSTVNNAAIQREEIASWPFRFGEWQDIHLHVLWSYSNAGYMTIYRNRRPIFVETGHANCENNSPARGGSGNYPQLGVYLSKSINATVYHRGLLVGGKDATFADMYPELNPADRVSLSK
jgi:hypothetical protein